MTRAKKPDLRPGGRAGAIRRRSSTKSRTRESLLRTISHARIGIAQADFR